MQKTFIGLSQLNFAIFNLNAQPRETRKNCFTYHELKSK